MVEWSTSSLHVKTRHKGNGARKELQSDIEDRLTRPTKPNHGIDSHTEFLTEEHPSESHGKSQLM